MAEKCPTCGRSMLLAPDPPGVLPTGAARPPFDWSPYIRYAIQGVIMLLAGIGAYYAPRADQKAGQAEARAASAETHAETAAAQSRENGAELKAHGEKLKKLTPSP